MADYGITDVRISVRGSAATGRAYSEQSGRYTGHRFDRGENGLSDIDIAIVSPNLYQRLREAGIKPKPGGWIGPLTNQQLEALKLPPVAPTTIDGVFRGNTIMVYPNKRVLQSRGPWMQLGE